jgi:UMF1 family MFS transporter
MQDAADFWVVGMLVAMAQGGTASMTRSLGARMIPKSKSGEFFGFVSVMIKFAGIVGPALFGVIAQVMGSSRLGYLSLTAFFIVGILILAWVDENKAMAVAQAEEARLAGA